MSRIRLLAQTSNTVTLRRADFQALLEAAENNVDLAAVERHRAEEKRVGWDVAKRNYLTREEAERALEGESLIRIWREKRGVTQRALAEAAQVPVSYLSEIEGGKKPGSRGALQSIAEILELPMELLTSNPVDGPKPMLHPLTRSQKAAAKLEKLAEESPDRDRLAGEAHAIVAEWLAIAERDGVRHQVRLAIGTLDSLIQAKAKEWIDRADQPRNAATAKRMKQVSDALEAAVDALDIEYGKL